MLKESVIFPDELIFLNDNYVQDGSIVVATSVGAMLEISFWS